MLMSLAIGCSDPVTNLAWTVQHPFEREDGLFFAIEAVRAANRGNDTAHELIKLLDSDDPSIRSTAAGGSSSVDADPEIVVPWLLKLTTDRDLSVRVMSLSALAGVRPADERAVAALAAAAKDDDRGVRGPRSPELRTWI